MIPNVGLAFSIVLLVRCKSGKFKRPVLSFVLLSFYFNFCPRL